MNKKLYRSSNDKMICGVCGGIGEYFGVDPTLVRLGAALFGLVAGSGLFVYFIMALIVPENPNFEMIDVPEKEGQCK